MFGISGIASSLLSAKAMRQQAAANWQQAMNDPVAFQREKRRQLIADETLIANSLSLGQSKFMTPSEALANPFRSETKTIVRDTGIGWGTVVTAFILGGMLS